MNEQASTMRALARSYLAFGFNIVPLGNDKRPVVTGVALSGQPVRFRWEDWQSIRQQGNLLPQLFKPAWWADVRGVAGICGPVSGHLVCVDFDGTDQDLLNLFLARLESSDSLDHKWTVRTPGNGLHFWVRCPDLDIPKGVLDRPARHSAGHVELRFTGHYAALPGSLHPSGGQYDWLLAAPSEPPSVVAADRLLAAYMDVTDDPPQPAPTTERTTTHQRTSGYAEQALDNEVALLLSAKQGQRNHALNTAAFNLGQLVAGHALDASTVEDRLHSAATSIGLGESETTQTIRSGMEAGRKQPRALQTVAISANGNDAAYIDGFAGETPDPAVIDDEPTKGHKSWPYAVKDGRMCYCYEKDGDIERKPIADFTAKITEEVLHEDGSKSFVVTGRALRSGSFSVDVPADVLGDERKLKTLLDAAVGAKDPIYKGMAGHLTAAIKLLTPNELSLSRHYDRVGWQGDTFLLPGLHPEQSTIIELPRMLPYHAPGEDADMDSALLAFHALINSVSPVVSTPIISMLLQAPLMRRMGMDGERYGIFIQGRTGSLKTSWAQTAMCLYGAFNNESLLVKWGEGSTRNAIMSIASHAHDLPFLVDNYKSSTGFGYRDFTNLIHNIMEGGEKHRLTRSSKLKDPRPIHCSLLLTGEDIPAEDAAAIARLLSVHFEWQNGQPNDELAVAQRFSNHLPALGASWLTWLEQQSPFDIADQLHALRTKWAAVLLHARKDMANAMRVTTNLSSNEIAWQIALTHPVIGPALAPYSAHHAAGLMRIAETMAAETADAGEAQQFVSALRELLATGQYVLQPRGVEPSDLVRDRLLGWQDDSGVYLLPAIALAAVKRLLGPGSLPGSVQSLYGQLDGLGWIAAKGEGHTARVIRVGGSTQRVLHLHWRAIRNDGENAPMDMEALGL